MTTNRTTTAPLVPTMADRLRDGDVIVVDRRRARIVRRTLKVTPGQPGAAWQFTARTLSTARTVTRTVRTDELVGAVRAAR